MNAFSRIVSLVKLVSFLGFVGMAISWVMLVGILVGSRSLDGLEHALVVVPYVVVMVILHGIGYLCRSELLPRVRAHSCVRTHAPEREEVPVAR